MTRIPHTRREEQQQQAPPVEPARAPAAPAAPAALLALQASAGNAAVTRMVTGGRTLARQKVADPPKAEAGAGYPWAGTIKTPWNAALRKTPKKDEEDPHGNTLADLPKGHAVTVIGKERGWLQVETDFDGKHLTGYVSHELVERMPVLDMSDEPMVVIGNMTVANALLSLKRAEHKRDADPKWTPQSPETELLAESKKTLEDTGKYEVDMSRFRVSFKKAADGSKIKIQTIEDFILFVEAVEREYAGSSPAEIASEIRQIWFSDENWDVLVASEGIKRGGKSEDIETEPNPIAKQFDMKDLAPKGKGKTIATKFGAVDVGHVLAGIDAALSGSPTTAPKGGDDAELKWKTLRGANKGDARDFATWSGDLGQAYAEYLVRKWVEKKDVRLMDVVEEKSPRDQLLGDIHGYIALKVTQDMPAKASPTGSGMKVSDLLRNLYLVGKTQAGMGGKSYWNHMQEMLKKSNAEMRPHIIERTLAFARPWYAAKAAGSRGWWGSEGWTKEGILENGMKDCDEKHKLNESKMAGDNTLKALLDKFIDMLAEIMP